MSPRLSFMLRLLAYEYMPVNKVIFIYNVLSFGPTVSEEFLSKCCTRATASSNYVHCTKYLLSTHIFWYNIFPCSIIINKVSIDTSSNLQNVYNSHISWKKCQSCPFLTVKWSDSRRRSQITKSPVQILMSV